MDRSGSELAARRTALRSAGRGWPYPACRPSRPSPAKRSAPLDRSPGAGRGPRSRRPRPSRRATAMVELGSAIARTVQQNARPAVIPRRSWRLSAGDRPLPPASDIAEHHAGDRVVGSAVTYRLRFSTAQWLPGWIQALLPPAQATHQAYVSGARDRFRRGACSLPGLSAARPRGCPRARGSPARRRGRRRRHFDCLFDGQQNSLHVHVLHLQMRT